MTRPAPKIAVVIVAAGRGQRLANESGSLPKQYMVLEGRSIVARSIEAFTTHPDVNFVQPVINGEDSVRYEGLQLKHSNLLTPVTGGSSRQISVKRGLEALRVHEPDLVLIHDAARPLVSSDVIDSVIAGLAKSEAVLPVTAVIDTIKRSDDGAYVSSTEDRSRLYAAQTPQGFHFRLIMDAHRKAAEISDSFTDDTAIAEWANMRIALSQGSPDNIKITLPGDLKRATSILRGGQSFQTRMGSGLDVHRFVEGDGLMLCGVPVDHDKRLDGHSDADAGLHVLTDALLGALAEGDIGTHFPPTDAKWRGEPSKTFMSFAAERVRERGGRIVHLDVTLMCEAPKIRPYVDVMRQSIAEICRIGIGRVSVKATTSEKMGFVGRGEGLFAQGLATIELPEDD